MYFLRQPERWQSFLHGAVEEMERITRPGGTMILIETLGTGNKEPRYIHGKMKELSRIAEEDRGFSRRWIRTDYRYESVQQTEEFTRFFFGDELADRVRDRDWVIVPECTALLWKKKA